jgi:aspartate racemase
MARHIGIVACSAEGAALCYRTICKEGAELMGEHFHPEVSLHNHALAEYMKFIVPGDWQGVARLMLSSAKKLEKSGADFLISPDNTIHQSFDLVAKSSPLPWLHIAEEVAKEAQAGNYSKLGITGTRFLMEGPVYPEKLEALGIEHEIPDKSDRDKINEIIFQELVYGRILDASRNYFHKVIRDLGERGCNAVVLGCTEIPLIVLSEDSPLPTLDSTRILARAALNKAVDGGQD